MFRKACLLAILGALAPTCVLGETILGVTVFSRHGDRTSKHYSGYSLTSLGFQQNFQIGSDYRSTYLVEGSEKRILGISESRYVPAQVYASAPDQMVLLNTATAFLQGLYPPLDEDGASSQIASQTLNNGSTYTNPLNGYQYVVLHGEDTDSPDTIWIKGDDGCPAYTREAATFEDSAEFLTLEENTHEFYESFYPILDNVYDYKPGNMSYANAYDIFDLINVASVHNASLAGNVSSADLFQLRTLADSAEWGENYNASLPMRSIGGKTLAGAMLTQLNQTVSSKGKLKFSLLAGSYDTFLAFFGLTNLTAVNPDFYGLPAYASTMAFELFTDDDVEEFPTSIDDINVRFLFRNGSGDGSSLETFPLFGRQENAGSMSWTDFVAEMKSLAVMSVDQWCSACGSTEDFCLASNRTSASPPTESGGSQSTEPADSGSSDGGMSNAVAGVIGVMVTLGIVALVGVAAWLLRRRRSTQTKTTPPVLAVAPVEKTGSLSSGERV